MINIKPSYVFVAKFKALFLEINAQIWKFCDAMLVLSYFLFTISIGYLDKRCCQYKKQLGVVTVGFEI